MLLIDKMSSTPVYEQVIEGIERNVLLGLHPPGSVLPSLRELSVTLGINPNTIQKSYAELTRRGVICPAPGSGCYVAKDATERIRARAEEKLSAIRDLAAELKLTGMPCEQVVEVIRQVYAADGNTLPCSHTPSSDKGGTTV